MPKERDPSKPKTMTLVFAGKRRRMAWQSSDVSLSRGNRLMGRHIPERYECTIPGKAKLSVFEAEGGISWFCRLEGEYRRYTSGVGYPTPQKALDATEASLEREMKTTGRWLGWSFS